MARFGSLGTQYFDNSGDPLISGKIYFYESGTTTPKNTYADESLLIANANPVILNGSGRQPNVFFNGTAKALLTSGADVQVEVRDPVGSSSTTNFDTWNIDRIYDIPEVVSGSDNAYYRSTSDNNIGNDPTTPGTTFWSEVRFIEVWDADVTYDQDIITLAPDGKLYRSTTSNNLGHTPSSSPTFWQSLYSGVGNSVVTVNTGLGYASTNTKIRRHSVIEENSGTDITYTDSVTDGESFTINTPGLYQATVRDLKSTTGCSIGISKNSNQLTTDIASITAAHRKMFISIKTGNPTVELSVLIYCEAGDVLRQHDSGANDSTSALSMCSVRKINNI